MAPNGGLLNPDWRRRQPGQSAWFGAGEFHHLAPLLDLFGQDLGEIRAGAGQDQAAEVGEARLDPGIAERPVDLPVELVDDVGRGVLC